MWSSQDLLALKPFCSSTSILLLSRNVDILRFIKPVKSFPIVDIRLILLKLTGSLGSKCEPFGKGLIRDLSHSVGARQVLKKFQRGGSKYFWSFHFSCTRTGVGLDLPLYRFWIFPNKMYFFPFNTFI